MPANTAGTLGKGGRPGIGTGRVVMAIMIVVQFAAPTGGEETTVHATALHSKLIQRVSALVCVAVVYDPHEDFCFSDEDNPGK